LQQVQNRGYRGDGPPPVLLSLLERWKLDLIYSLKLAACYLFKVLCANPKPDPIRANLDRFGGVDLQQAYTPGVARREEPSVLFSLYIALSLFLSFSLSLPPSLLWEGQCNDHVPSADVPSA